MTAPAHYTCRQLARTDVGLLKDLLRVFGDAFGETEAYQHSVPTDDYLVRLLGKPHFIAVVATADDEVVGGLAAYELDKFEQDRREIYIYDLAVAERHRRRGIAKALIGELRQTASRRMCTSFSCRPTRRTARPFLCTSRCARRKPPINSTSPCPHRSATAAGPIANAESRRISTNVL
jgi:aminoglycoside 3-N-acetyltransferase I